jgi:hypothetical protein
MDPSPEKRYGIDNPAMPFLFWIVGFPLFFRFLFLFPFGIESFTKFVDRGSHFPPDFSRPTHPEDQQNDDEENMSSVGPNRIFVYPLSLSMKQPLP